MKKYYTCESIEELLIGMEVRYLCRMTLRWIEPGIVSFDWDDQNEVKKQISMGDIQIPCITNTDYVELGFKYKGYNYEDEQILFEKEVEEKKTRIILLDDYYTVILNCKGDTNVVLFKGYIKNKWEFKNLLKMLRI